MYVTRKILIKSVILDTSGEEVMALTPLSLCPEPLMTSTHQQLPYCISTPLKGLEEVSKGVPTSSSASIAGLTLITVTPVPDFPTWTVLPPVSFHSMTMRQMTNGNVLNVNSHKLE